MTSNEWNSPFRHEGYMFFIYDHKKKTEEDDPSDAILYFYPRTVSVDIQIALVGGLIGIADFCVEFLPQCMPNLVKLSGHNFALIQHEDYIIALSGNPDIPDRFLINHMQYVWNTFKFYQGSIGALRERVSEDLFVKELKLVWDMYLPLCQLRGDVLSQAFQTLPYVQLHKSHGSLFLHASHILQRCLKHEGVIAGTLFNRNRVLCSQLNNSLTRILLLLLSNGQFPYVQANPSLTELPGGVRLLRVFLSGEESDKMIHRRQRRYVRKPLPVSQPKDMVGRKSEFNSSISDNSHESRSEINAHSGDIPDRQNFSKASSSPCDDHRPSPCASPPSSVVRNSSTSFTSGTDSDIFLDTLQDVQMVDPREIQRETKDKKHLKQSSESKICEMDNVSAETENIFISDSQAYPSQGSPVVQPRETVIGSHNHKICHDVAQNQDNSSETVKTEQGIIESAEVDIPDINRKTDSDQYQGVIMKSNNDCVYNSESQIDTNVSVSNEMKASPYDNAVSDDMKENKTADPNNCKDVSATNKLEPSVDIPKDEENQISNTLESFSHSLNKHMQALDEKPSDEIIHSIDTTLHAGKQEMEMSQEGQNSNSGYSSCNSGQRTDGKDESFLSSYENKSMHNGSGNQLMNKTDEQISQEFSFLKSSSDFEGSSASDKLMSQNPELQTSFNEPVVNAELKAESTKMDEMTLYVQGHSDTLLVILLKRSTRCDKNYINSLWKSCLSYLAELDFEVKDAERHLKDDSENIGSSYKYITYDSVTQKLRGSVLQPVSSLANEMVDTSVQMHDSFLHMPHLHDITLRSNTASTVGQRNHSSERYFQIGASRMSAGICLQGDKTFTLDRYLQSIRH